MSSKKVSFESALKNNYIKKFDYTKFENIERIASGGFGTVYRAKSLILRKLVALKCLHGDDESFFEKFVKELTNIVALNCHDNIIKFYGISIDPSTETHYLVLQYAKDGDLRTYLRNNFNTLDWKIKIQMAKDITSGLYCIHEENIVHRDLVTFKECFSGMPAYLDPRYLQNPFVYKRSKASDIYSLGVLFWELSSGRPPFNNFPSLGIPKIVINGEREIPINGTPEDYIIIYSNAWKDDPDQRPTIKNIFDSLKNIKLENIYSDLNDNQSRASMDVFSISQASMDKFSKDSVSLSSSFATSNLGEVTVSQVSIENIKDHVSDQTLTDSENLEITGIDNSSIYKNNSSILNIS
ncbi:hypothetical protein Glove_230g56 [Diversispora epigaea]|uniref:Protein kinase domain-containing protein n=1 Tax=Diversispora epigaea TaxID=1348612 RepID=A0A397ICG0_9GLOM|nr:hypothetical protein Glove_230g56 [Diversispora epigaea]